MYVQKCEDSAFCSRLRGASGEVCSVVPSSVSVQESAVTATLLCGVESTELDLSLTAYEGIIRLYVNEAGEAGSQRFQVPHVLLSTVASSATTWHDSAKASNSIKLSLSTADVTLQFNPLQLDVTISGTPALSFNSRQLFTFEHLRTKQVTLQPRTYKHAASVPGIHAVLPQHMQRYNCRKETQKDGGKSPSRLIRTANHLAQRASLLTSLSLRLSMFMVCLSMPPAWRSSPPQVHLQTVANSFCHLSHASKQAF